MGSPSPQITFFELPTHLDLPSLDRIEPRRLLQRPEAYGHLVTVVAMIEAASLHHHAQAPR